MRRLALLPVLIGANAAAQSDTTRRDTAYLAPTIVTVTRAPLALERAPFAVGVTTRDQIQRGKPGLALDEALAGIAGVQVDNRYNYALGERISIRGFGARAQFGVRGVRVLLDGIPMTLADGQTSLNNVDVATVSRAEVIRGPASALHGNAAGGVIQLETDRFTDVTARTAGGSLRTDYGEHGLLRTQLALAGRSWTSDYWLSASRLRFDGYRQWNDARNDHIALRVGGPPIGGTDLALTFNWVDYDGKNPGGLSSALLSANRDTAFVNNLNNRTGEEGTQGQVGLTWRQKLLGADLDLSLHGLKRHVDNPIPQRIVVIDRNAGGARAALSGASAIGTRSVRLAAGGEVQIQRDDRRNYVNAAPATPDAPRRPSRVPRGADTLNQLERVTNAAVFAQAGVDLVPRLALMLGVRHDHIRFEADDRLVGTGNADDSGARAMTATSPSVGLTWSPLRLLDVYSNYSTSFETPTTSELANQESGAGGLNPLLDPQRTRSVEAGLNGRVTIAGVGGSYQLAAYEARVEDALIPFEVATVPGRQYYRNAGSTKHRGIESATSLVLPWRLTLRGTFTHTDARFVRYVVTTGTTTTVFDGKRVPGVAANRGDVTLSFQPGKAFADFETRALSSIPVNDANTEKSPSSVIHSIRLGVRDVRAGALLLQPHIGVLNLFDRDHNTSVVVNAFGGRFYEPGPPRSLYGGLNFRF
jgi:iron complex outermembrane receptor protein